MEILKAYCLELDKIIDPYEAREAYFYANDESLKFNFYCSNENCRIELVGANIYRPEEVAKRPPYFRTKPNHPHKEQCEYYEGNITEVKKYHDKFFSDKIKEDIYPAVLNIHELENIITIKPIKTTEITDKIIEEKISNAVRNYDRKNLTRTRYLEKVVNYYETHKDCGLPLKIGDETRKYKNWFKRILFFRDGKDFIFWDYIYKIKKYGNHYLIEFRTKSFNDRLPFSTYITQETIENYRHKKYFIKILNYLMDLINNKNSTNEVPICYFFKTYPELSSNPFAHYDIPVKDLRYFVIKSTEQKV